MPLSNTAELINRFKLDTFTELSKEEQDKLAQAMVDLANFPKAPAFDHVVPSYVSDENHSSSDAIFDYVITVAPQLALEKLHLITAALIDNSPQVRAGTYMRNNNLAKYFLAYEMVHHEARAQHHFELARMKREFNKPKDIENLKETILHPIMIKMGYAIKNEQIDLGEEKLHAVLEAQYRNAQQTVIKELLRYIDTHRHSFKSKKRTSQRHLSFPFNLPPGICHIYISLKENDELSPEVKLEQTHLIVIKQLSLDKAKNNYHSSISSQEKDFYHYAAHEINSCLAKKPRTTAKCEQKSVAKMSSRDGDKKTALVRDNTKYAGTFQASPLEFNPKSIPIPETYEPEHNIAIIPQLLHPDNREYLLTDDESDNTLPSPSSIDYHTPRKLRRSSVDSERSTDDSESELPECPTIPSLGTVQDLLFLTRLDQNISNPSIEDFTPRGALRGGKKIIEDPNVELGYISPRIG